MSDMPAVRVSLDKMTMTELRQFLTDAVRLARHGTTIKVTDHGRTMCYIVPPSVVERQAAPQAE